MGQNSVPMHAYPLWVVHIPKLDNVAPILWPQQVPQDLFKLSKLSMFKVIVLKSKVMVTLFMDRARETDGLTDRQS